MLINTNIVTNLIFESESKFKKSLLKILTLKKRQNIQNIKYIYMNRSMGMSKNIERYTIWEIENESMNLDNY